MKKKWLAVIAFSLLSAACSDDNIGNFPSAAGAENPTSAGIKSSGIESSADSPDVESSSAISSSSVMSSSVESSAESSAESSTDSDLKIESSSSATPKSSATNFLDTPFGDYEYAITDSYEGGAGGFGGGFSDATTSTKGGAGGVSVTGGSPGGAGGVGGSSGAGGLGGTNNRTSGLLTAGEWNDLDNWKFWSDLLNENKYYEKTSYWKFYPKNLVAVQVVDGNNTAIANVPVELLKGGTVLFTTKTDNA